MTQQEYTIFCKTCGGTLGVTSNINDTEYECTRCFQKRTLKAAMLEGRVAEHDKLTTGDLSDIVKEVDKADKDKLQYSFGERINAEVEKIKK